jgi:hypothetical protein
LSLCAKNFDRAKAAPQLGVIFALRALYRRAVRMGVSVRVSVIGAAALCLLLLALSPSDAQSPPLPPPGFITSHEVTRIARSAGFDPVSPPLREGTSYVLRAMDFRGILMRVVVDARSGAIRAVNRIVAGPGFYGPPIGMAAPYGFPDGYGLGMAPGDEIVVPPTPPMPPFVGRTAVHPIITPPLPRPRPAALASRRPVDEMKPAANTVAMPGNAAAAAVAPLAPSRPALVPLND